MLHHFPAIALAKRELLSGLRLKRTYALLVLTVGATFLVLAGNLAFKGRDGLSSRDVESFLQLFSQLLFWPTLLFVPALAGASLGTERQRQTLDLLRISLIRPFALVLAKSAYPVVVCLLIMAATMPLVGLLFFFAGIDWSQFALVIVFLVLSTLTCASIGVMSSSRVRRTSAALALSYLGVVAFLGAPAIAPSLSGYDFFTDLPSFFWHIENAGEVCFPPLAVARVASADLSAGQTAFAAAYQAAIAAVCLWAAVRGLRRPSKPLKVDARRPIHDPAVLDRRRKQFPFYLFDPQRSRGSIRDGRNPMYVKEMHTGLLAHATRRIRISYLVMVFSFLVSVFPAAMVYSPWDALRLVFLIVLLDALLVLVWIPGAVSLVFVKEHESGTLDLLRMTLLRPREIVLGKLFAVVPELSPLALGLLFGTLPAVLFLLFRFGGDPRAAVTSTALISCAFLLVSFLLAAALSLRYALLARSTGSALVLAYVANLVIFVLMPVTIVALIDVVPWHRLLPEPWLCISALPFPTAFYMRNWFGFPKGLEGLAYCGVNALSCTLFAVALIALSVHLYRSRIARTR